MREGDMLPRTVVTKAVVHSLERVQKKCSRKNCVTLHCDVFKTCPRCREYDCALQKRKRAAKPHVPPLHRRCANCCKTKPDAQFQRKSPRQTKLTAWCKSCRAVQARSRRNPSTRIGACRALYLGWREGKTCKECGTADCIEADHVNREDKRRDKNNRTVSPSENTFWASHGGEEALALELAKCQPLCKFDHRVKTQQENANKKEKPPCIRRKEAFVKAEKLRRGSCLKCGRVVTQDTCCGFDFDHRDATPEGYLMPIARLIRESEAFFYDNIQREFGRCDLLCANCHKYVTDERRRVANAV